MYPLQITILLYSLEINHPGNKCTDMYRILNGFVVVIVGLRKFKIVLIYPQVTF